MKALKTKRAGAVTVIKSQSDFSGVVYAPNADIVVMAMGDVYGSFIGNDFERKQGGNFYYDEALKDIRINDVGVRFVLDQWSEN